MDQPAPAGASPGDSSSDTQSVEAVAALRRSEERYRALVEATNQLVWSWSPSGENDFSMTQGWWADLTGQSVADQIANPLGWLDHLHPDDRDVVAEAWGASTTRGNPYDIEYRVRDRAGGWRYIHARGVPIPGPGGTVREWVGTLNDITDRRRAEAELRQSEVRLRRLASAGIIGVIRWDLDRSLILEANDEFLRMTGYDRADLAAGRLDFRAMTPPEWTPRNESGIRDLRETGVGGAYEKEYIRKDGGRVPVIIVGVRFEEAASEGMSFVMDITGRKKAEQMVRESARQAAAILESITDAFFALDRDWRFTYVNQQARRMLGLQPGELLGTTLWDSFPGLVGSDFERVYRAAMGGRPSSLTSYYPDHARWYEVHVYPAPEGVAIYFRDVTDRIQADRAIRESEERYRSLFDSLDEGFCVIEVLFEGDRATDYRFLEVNPAFEKHTGVVGATGRTMRSFVPDHDDHWFEVYGRVVHTGEPIRFVNEARGLGGRWFDLYAFRLGGPGSHKVAVLFTNVTAQRQAEAERERLLAQLKEADRKKDEFIALLAHELRNPLAPLRNGLLVLRLTQDPPERDRAQGMMERQLAHMVRLVDDLLDVSRISRNKMELRRERVLLADVVASAVETVSPVIQHGRHELTVSLPPGPLPLDADLTRLAQVFSNLLTNSARYTPPGGKIWLTAERPLDVGEGGGWVRIAVRDTGIGIPASAQPHIFDMFSQVDRSLERSTGGLGIGLALVKGLAEMHGGWVSVHSPGEGKGSTFTVTLPVMPEPAAARPDAPHAAAAPVTGWRILVVDDNPDGVESLSLLLELLGNKVSTARDGLEAVAQAEAFRPEVILMDVGMPRLNGLDATRRIRERPWGRGVTIIALTGWGQEDDLSRSREAGCDGHLVKPVDLGALRDLLDQARDARSRG